MLSWIFLGEEKRDGVNHQHPKQMLYKAIAETPRKG